MLDFCEQSVFLPLVAQKIHLVGSAKPVPVVFLVFCCNFLVAVCVVFGNLHAARLCSIYCCTICGVFGIHYRLTQSTSLYENEVDPMELQWDVHALAWLP